MVTPKYTKQFEEFWRQYPNGPRNNSNQKTRGLKPRAWAVWKRMSMEERFAAMDAVKTLKRDPYIWQASVWLNNTGWDTGDKEEIDWKKELAQKKQDKERQELREGGTAKWLREQTPKVRKQYAIDWPIHKWLVDEIEAEIT